MDTEKFDVLLDASDPDFLEDLRKALGVNDLAEVEFVTPQFDRTDGRTITYHPNTVEEYHALPKMSDDSLKKIGCSQWGEPELGKLPEGVIWLFPHEWYDYIPDGLKIIDICENEEEFKRGETDDDKRFGYLAYGFFKPAESVS